MLTIVDNHLIGWLMIIINLRLVYVITFSVHVAA